MTTDHDDIGPARDEPSAGLRVAAALGLEPLRPEGGFFRRIYTGPQATAIHYLVTAGDFSALHRVRGSDELFFFHAGAPLEMLTLTGPEPEIVLLGPDPGLGQRPAITVPAGVWQGAATTGGWTLMSTVVTPGFRWSDFDLGDRAELHRLFPAAIDRINRLTRG